MSKKNLIISPVATAVWLVDNTALTFAQIAEFCGLYENEIQSIADGLMGSNVIAVNPILNKSLTTEEIKRCEKSPKSSLKQCFDILKGVQLKVAKKKKYTPMAQRRNRPEAVLWLVTFAPELSDGQIIKLVRTTKTMIEAIREKTHKEYSSLIPKDPVIVGFCTQKDLNTEIEKAKKKIDSNIDVKSSDKKTKKKK